MCVIIYTILNNKTILAKNRDRFYNPKIEIVHEIINGTEIVYTRDDKSKCIDGMNEYGIGYINSQLSTKHYENIDVSRDYQKKEMDYIKENGPLIKIDMLSSKNINQAFDTIIDNKYFEDLILNGHILLASPNKCFHIESTTQNPAIIKEINSNIVFTNHGVSYPEAGKKPVRNYQSSLWRKRIIEKRLQNVKNVNELLPIMRERCPNEDPFFCPYKDKTLQNKDKKIENTTNQVMYNLTDKIVVFNYDANSSQFLGIKNNLPRNYKPKIKIEINEIGTRQSIPNLFIYELILILIILVVYTYSKI